MKCTQCGNEISDGMNFCKTCGAAVPAKKSKKKLIWIIAASVAAFAVVALIFLVPWAVPEIAKTSPEAVYKNSMENAIAIVTGINTYNVKDPDNKLPDNPALAQVKAALSKEKGFWPEGLSDQEEAAAWKLVEFENGIALVKTNTTKGSS